ncbi:MAG: ABC transporter permease [Deltaproteobacteria bacterium]|nr:ABC transporter permease [Deltaproteobacteria bacterium]
MPRRIRRRILATLLRREIYRFARLLKQTVVPSLVTTLLFILVFGVSLGGHIREISGWSYIQYILPGLAALGVITNAYANTSTSLYAARFDRSIENWLTVPISPLQFVVALISGGVLRAVLVGVLTILIAVVVVDLPVQSPLLTFAWMVLMAVIFASLGIVSGLRAESWDSLATMTNFVLTPGIYLGGVFYSVGMLPEPWQTISYGNPIFYCIDGIRGTVLGTADLPLWHSGAVVVATAIGMFSLCWWLFQRGYRLVK